MGKLKLAELVILTISALVNAAKSIIKFIDYIIKLRRRTPATGTT